MVRLIVLILICGSVKAQVPDTTGWVMPFLAKEDGRIIEMNVALLRPIPENVDSIFFTIQFEFPKDQAPYYSTIKGDINLTFEPALLLPRCFAIKARNQAYGQYWRLCDPLGRPIQYLLDRGFTTLTITQTGFK